MIRNFKFKGFLFAFFVICCLISCEKDVIEPIQEESIFPKISGRIVTPSKMQNDPLAYDRLMDYLQKPVAKSSQGIELDTTFIKTIDTDSYSSYTFNIKQDSIERKSVLRNFMLTVVNDTIQIQHLIDYPVLSNGRLDMDNITMRRLYGDQLLNVMQPKCGGTNTIWYSYQEAYPYNCGGASGSGAHGPGDDRCKADPDDKGGYGTITRWGSFTVNEPPCATIDAGSGPRGGGGDGTITVPVNPTDPDNPCLNNSVSDGNGGCFDGSDDLDDLIEIDPTIKDLNDLIKKDTSFVKIKDAVNLMRTKTTDSVEYSLSLYKDLVGGEEVTKSRTREIVKHKSLTSGYVNIGSFDFCNIHTHPYGTHEMFSFQDIFTLKKMYDALNPIVQEKAMMMLVTSSGSVYAIKINDIEKLTNEISDALNFIDDEYTEKQKIKILTEELGYKYDKNSSNLEDYFLDVFEDFGISLYKATDSNLTD